ncbi:MAG: bifunctional 4-hydroxy-2-oxoglutarate aldolase/2-dehydro-3-deoxy-phosphogluconate aldolase [Acidiferrobacterales bacterium]|nr:bifunctional 4-hydroxy-2-oxoglutarate aldolase/2-dehydro-3-deoxy-phosphogluconate aldolase [Acidiferrobacterales bacterium]
MSKSPTVESQLNGQQVVPVVVINNKEEALGLPQALIDGGINVIEITLRNDYGLEAIEVVKKAFPDMLVFAGTVKTSQEAIDVVNAGAQGIVTPGVTDALLNTIDGLGVSYLPGVTSPSHVLMAMENGLTECKLFPASVVGGLDMLKAMNGPFPSIRFCPTGGVGPSNFKDYLALNNVMFVGGSWIAPSSMIKAQDWAGISELSRAASF